MGLALSIVNLVGRTAVAAPLHSLRTFLPALGDNLHLLRYHEAGVEAQTKMSDDVVGIVLVLLKEVRHTREGNLIDILVNLLLSHADTVVANGDGTLVGIQAHADGQVAQLVFVVALFLEGLQLLRSIDGIRHHLTQENLLVAIEKLFDDGENVLGCNPNVTFLHNIFCF